MLVKEGEKVDVGKGRGKVKKVKEGGKADVGKEGGS